MGPKSWPARVAAAWARRGKVPATIGSALATSGAPLVVATMCAAAAVLLFTNGGQDDKYITYWPAKTLAEHGAILNYNGARLEQSSSLSLVVLLALLFKLLPLSMPTLGSVASLSLLAATLVLAARLARLAEVARPAWAALAVGTVASLLYWATSGMETTLVTASELATVLLLSRLGAATASRGDLAAATAACVAFAASRPESPVVLAAIVVGFGSAALAGAIARRGGGSPWRGPARAASIAVVAVGLVLAFRRAYFHAWVPNPAVMKAPGFDAAAGARYLWRAFVGSGLHLLAAFAVGLTLVAARAARAKPIPPPLAMLAAAACAHLGFAIASGGDWMTGARFLAPAVPALVLTSIFSVALASPQAAPAIAALVATANVLASLQFAHGGESDGRPLWTTGQLRTMLERRVGTRDLAWVELGNKLHLRDAVTIGEFLTVVDRARAARPSPLWVMTGQAGMMGFHLMARHFGDVKMYDLWSLTSRDLYDCLPRGAVRGSKWGSKIGLEEALRVLSTDGARCGLPMPDLYYNECLTPADRGTLERNGYVLVYEQRGVVANSAGAALFPGQVSACGHFAVRRELAAHLGLHPGRTWTWDITPR